MLTLIADKIVPSGLVLIVYQFVSMLTLIAEEIVPLFGIDSLLACVHDVDIDSYHDCAQWFGIDSLLACVCVDIDSWRDRAPVWHW